MKEDLIADIWTVIIEHIPEKNRRDVAADFISTLMDYGIKESVLEELQGVDPYLDTAIEYVIDGEDIGDDLDNDYDYDENEE
jgi:hypothetical protein